MTRQVPTDQPLSDEDRQYLKDRGQYATIEAIDREQGLEAEPSGNLGLLGSEPSLQADRQEGAGVGEAQALLYTDPTAEPNSGDDDKDYDNWSKAELQDELEERGLPKSGNVADLVQRLRDDDDSESVPEDDDDEDEDKG